MDSDIGWPSRPPLLPGESLSSWFARVAESNALSAGQLYRAALPGAHLYSIDLDRAPCRDLLSALSDHTGHPVQRLQQATFSRWAGTVFDRDDGRRKLPWLPPGGGPKGRSCGHQYCPQCLAEGPAPYFRLRWRLSFVTVCERHGALLQDRCARCGEPVRLLALHRDREALHCPTCRTRLQDISTLAVEPAGLTPQRQFLQVIRDGWAADVNGAPLYAPSFFQLAAILARLLCGGELALPLRTWLGERMPTMDNGGIHHVPRVKEIARLNPSRRHLLMMFVWRLLADWPATFVEACRANHISQRLLTRHPDYLPFVFWDPVTRHLSAPNRRIGAAELEEGIAHLHRHGRIASYRALTTLFGTKFVAHQALAEPTGPHAPYGTGRYWKLDGVTPEVRHAVRVAAHQDGESVAAWVENALRDAVRRRAPPLTLDSARPAPQHQSAGVHQGDHASHECRRRLS